MTLQKKFLISTAIWTISGIVSVGIVVHGALDHSVSASTAANAVIALIFIANVVLTTYIARRKPGRQGPVER